ncbi:MAG TPA: ribosome recycling factor [Firmicutes bacterium]|jgi:ribosome recycling factor|nr:ribosome recycling factor [Bacillota bacterium]
MDELTLEAQNHMKKSIEALHANFNTLRTGRANAALLDRIEVDYYGDKILLNQIASISVPEARQLLIKPYDRNDVKAIITAISMSSIGINPINDGTSIRLMLPPLTEERRLELAKTAKRFADEAKVAIRNIRHEHLDLLTDDEYTEDLKKRIIAEIQKVTDEAVEEVDAAFKEKETEIMTI